MDRPIFDDQYITNLRLRNPETLRHFVAHFNPAIRAKMRSQFRWEDAEDLVQAVFVAALESVDSGGPNDPAKLPGYIFGICSNVARRYIREHSKPKPVDVDPELLKALSTGAEAHLVAESVAGDVRKVLGWLSPRDREILTRVFWREEDRDEICRDMGVDRDQLRLILHRALQRFRKGWHN